MRIAFIACLLVAVSAAAQAPAPQKTDTKGTTLDLRLDDVVRSPRITFGPENKDPESTLPALGDDARRIEPPKTRSQPSSSPFPKDTEQR